MTNILEAIYNIVNQKHFQIKEFYSSSNRANNMGEALENYIKDAFAGTFYTQDKIKRLEIFEKKFSWLGSQNNPPDIMIKGGDAIEVKKIQGNGSSLALNSSYPKADLQSSSPMITKECKSCEDWDVKDMIYCVGNVDDTKLKSLWLVYGSIYCAKHETYQRIKNTISEGIKAIHNVVFSETKELGRVNQVDPLGITNLRIRGMWQIEHPKKVYNYLHASGNQDFELVCIIPNEKYKSFPKESRFKIENMKEQGFSIENSKVKNPNNPAKLIDCKLIKFISKCKEHIV
ncbi:MAG: NgoPII family restriction endonuclease [Candidatus Cloacimonadota bacterium]|nr:MAG: NgoPII family restriction endonuclease [Candidatus Cloacimonadota bacterium]PIE77997.1 MAG: NgoPII family restriction endonuclease [Candidatus Delongbacteria bacterium]